MSPDELFYFVAAVKVQLIGLFARSAQFLHLGDSLFVLVERLPITGLSHGVCRDSRLVNIAFVQ